jgi:lysophospholipase L1-like esterase
MAGPRSWIRSIVRARRRIAFALTAVVLFFALTEGAVRLGGLATLPQETVFSDVYDPDYRLLPGAPNPFAKLEEHFNGSGFRGPDLTVPKPPGTVSIICTGDSTTQGAMVELEETYAAGLARLLTARGVNVEVLNAGIAGTTLWQQSRLIEQRLLAYRPDLIVMYTSPGFNERLLRLRQAMEDHFVLREVQSGLAHSHLYRLLRRGLRPPRFEDVMSQYAANPERPADTAAALDFARDDLAAVAKAASVAGVAVLVVPLLERESFAEARRRGVHANDAAWPSLLAEIDQAIVVAEQAAALGLPVFNAADAFLETSYDERLFLDGVHFTPAGHALMARLLAEEICRRSLLSLPCD